MTSSKWCKKLTSLFLVAVMLISAFPQGIRINASASETPITETEPEVQETIPQEETIDDESSDALITDDSLWEYSLTEGGAVLCQYFGSATDIYVPSTVDIDGKSTAVVKLADSIFENNDAVNSVTLGAGILEIGAKAFYDCDNLVCVLVSEALTTIGAEAFSGCNSFNSVILYSAVASIGENAFADCENAVLWVYADTYAHTYAVDNSISYKLIDSAAAPETIWYNGIEYYIMNGEAYAISYDSAKEGVTDPAVVNIPAAVNGYPVVELRSTFYNNTTITTVTLPSGIRSILNNTFRGCTKLTSINIPDGVATIGDYAFYNTAITSVTLPSALRSLGTRAFYECKSLTSVYFNDGLTSLNNETFYRCSVLKDIRLPDTLTHLGEGTFGGCPYISEIALPASLKTAGNGCFSGCTALKSITFPEGFESIEGTNFFNCCKSLTEVNFPSTLLSITGTNMFSLCTNLKELVIPGSTAITGAGFTPTYLETLIIGEGSKVTSYNGTAFGGAQVTKLVLPGSQGTVSDATFSGFYALRELVLGEGIQYISKNTFNNTKNLLSVVIPQSVISLQTTSFSKNTVLVVYENSYAHKFALQYNLLHFVTDGTTMPEFEVIDGITYYVTDTEAIAIHCDGSVTDIVMPEYVCGKPLTTLTKTFSGKAVESVKMPATVTTIIDDIFRGCGKIKHIEFSDNITSLPANICYACPALLTVHLPTSLKTLGTDAFYNCKALYEVNIPSNLTSIPNNAFYCCALGSVNIHEGITSIGYGAFYKNPLSSVTLPSTLTSIGANAFAYTNITSIDLPSKLTTIVSSAFTNCYYLKSITIPASVNGIPREAFCNCTNLESVIIENGVKTIGYSAFEKCTKLTSITIPSSVTTIDDFAFRNCTKLSEVNFSEGLTTVNMSPFSGCSALKSLVYPNTLITAQSGLFAGCSAITEAKIPGSLNSVVNHNFAGCTSLKKVEYGEGITQITCTQTYNCTSVTEVILPSTLLSVNSNIAFPALNKLTIAEGTTTVESGALVSCTELQTVIIPQSVTTLYTDSFAANTVLLVYEGSYAHQFALENGLLFFVYDGTNEPDIVTVDSVVYCLMNESAIAIAYEGDLEELVIPAEVNGVPVTELRATFKNNSVITSVTLPDSVTAIGDYTFLNCTALTSINIPTALTTIGNSAFENCTVLAMEMDLSNVTKIGTKAFISAGITKVVLGDSITVISAELFSNCSNLSEISIPDGLTEIGDYAFSKCPSLKSVNIPDSTKSIGAYAFWMSGLETLTGGNGITAIGNAAFSYTSITEAYIPASVGTVSMNVFYGCKNLKKVVIEDGITCIGGRAFYECSSLTDINLPDSITVIDYSAFYKCSSLKKIELPKNLTKIGREAFSLATGLTELTLPGTLGDAIGTEAFYCCSGIKSLVIGEGITKITKNMFYRCTGIESIVIPSTVTEIEAESFYACYNFKNVIIAEGFNSNLPENFKSCSHLAQIYIPTSLEKDLVFPVNTIILVEKDSFAHNYAMENNMLYFVIQRGGNPDIAYGKGISGTVSLSGGSAVAGATVEIYYDNGTLKETDTTDGNGTYSFTYAEVGSYTITATDANGNTAMTKVSVKRMNVFDVILEGDTNLKLKTAWSISGTVSEDTATVTLTDLDGNVINSLETNDGTFIITNVSNGTYIIKAETERSGIVREIHVFDGNLEGISLTLPEVATTGTIYGYAFVESRDKKHQSKRNWVNITVYNSDGIAIDSCKSDKNGWYMFTNLPLGEYNVVARVSEMRPDKNHKFDRNFELTGYAYVNIAEATEYQADIILREEHETKKSLSGKVTANGEHQACTVILSDVFGNEIASVTTSNNGKYVFANITDGAYFITAHTESDGSGFTFVIVINGRILGNTDIRVQKDSHIVNREHNFKNEVPDFKDRDECRSYKDRIAQEKRFYDGLSNKEKKQLSSEYVERLNRYVEWLAEIEYATNDNDVRIENGGMAVSKDELENDKQITFCLNVEKKNGHNASTDGINNEDDYKHHAMKDAAGKKEIKQYYDISLSKNVDGQEIPIESVCKDTNSTGKFRIVITIPEDHRGYKHYSLLHDHHGEIVTLADLDDDPNTITVEIDRFSTFALTATDEDLFITDPAEELYFKGASLTIQNNLNINYKIDKAHFDSIGFTDPYVVFNMKGVETVVSEYTDDGESYIFTFDNIAPHLMNETITATLYATLAGDEYSSSVHEYSIVTYAMNMLIRYAGDGSYEKLCTLLADMLIYGEMSQKYVGYKLDELATNQLTEEYLSFATSTLPEAVSVLDTEYTVTENATVKITGAGLNLEDNVKLRFTLSAASADGLEVRITTDSGNSWVIDSEDFVRSGNAYLVYLDELSMGQLREKVYVTVYSGDVAVSNTVRYSIESYAANKLEGDGSALSDLLVAMMKYGDSATAFKEN